MSMPLLGTVRPQIFSFPLYALTLVALSEDAVWLPLVFAVWANLHGGWLIGLGAVVVRTAFAPTKRRVLVAIGCAAATLFTPYGLSLVVVARRRDGAGWADVVEWQPVWRLSFGVQDAILWSVMVAAAVWARYKKLPASTWQWVWTLCVAIAAARVRRHMPFFSLDGHPVPLVAPPRARRRFLAASVDASSRGDSRGPAGPCRLLRRRSCCFDRPVDVPADVPRVEPEAFRRAVHSVGESPRTSADVVQLGSVRRVAGRRSVAGLVRQSKRDGVFCRRPSPIMERFISATIQTIPIASAPTTRGFRPICRRSRN